jgi:hypothetical protein
MSRHHSSVSESILLVAADVRFMGIFYKGAMMREHNRDNHITSVCRWNSPAACDWQQLKPNRKIRLCAIWLLVTVIVASTMGKPAHAQAPRAWLSRGIGGGGALYSPSISPYRANQIYMSTDMTGVFQTNNFGASWKTLPFQQLSGGVDTQIRFTSDPDILYAIDIGRFGERYPVRSSNGGARFVTTGDPTFGEAFTLHADPHSTSRLIVAGWDKLYFSKNNGRTFTQIFDAADPNNGIHLAGVFWDGRKIYVGTSRGLLVSTNNGSSFRLSQIPGLPANESFVSFAGAKNNAGKVRLLGVTFPRANVWGGITGAEVTDSSNKPRVYRLDIGSAGWIRVRNHVSANPYRPFFVSMALNNINTIYLAGTNVDTGAPCVLKSTNGGVNWKSVFRTNHNGNIATGWMGDGGDLQWYWGEVALGFAVSPKSASRLIITDYGFAHVSKDGGASWRQVYVRPRDENPPGRLTPIGLDYATAGVEQTSAWSLHWATPWNLLAGFSDIRGLRSTNRGVTWTAGTALGLPHNSTYQIVEHPTNGMLYAATSSVHDLYQSTYLQDSRIDGGTGMIVQSFDGGATWEPLYDFGHPVVWLAFDPDDNRRLYASVVHRTQGGIYVTDNLFRAKGPVFTRLNKPPRTEGHPLCVHVLNDGTIVSSWSGRRDASGAFTQSSGVFVSTDGGASWKDRTAPNLRRWTKDLVIDPYDAKQNTWYAAVFSHWGSSPNEVGGLYRTTNRGATWTELGDFYRVESITVDPLNPNKAYITTEADGLWFTNNLRAAQPTFRLDRAYPFQHPLRIFFNPFNPTQAWSTSFGGGLRILRP